MDARFRWAAALSLMFTLVIGLPVSSASPGRPPSGNFTITKPADAPLSRMIGTLRFDTWNPVTMTPLEDNTRLYFTVTNTGETARTLIHEAFGNLSVAGNPQVTVTVHRQFGEASSAHAATITIPAGASRSLEFTMERFLTQTDSTSTVPFTFRSVEDGVQAMIPIKVATQHHNPSLEATSTAYITGRVTNAAGKAIAGARVSAGLFALTNVRATTTDHAGRYRLGVLSLPDVRKLLGARPLPYGNLAYFVQVDAKGYSTVERTIGGPRTGGTVNVSMKLNPLSMLNYKEVGSFKSNGTLAYWWLNFADNRIIAVQGQHPPVTQRTGHMVAIDLRGRELWRQTTGGQCWGFDVASDNALVAAGCDDGYVYVNRTTDGALLYKLHTGNRPGEGAVNAVKFSPDSQYLAVDGTGRTDGTAGFTVLSANTGEVLWTSSVHTTGTAEQWAYKFAWSRDGNRLVAGDSGLITSFTSDGHFEWRRNVGYAPFVLAFDSIGNIYVGSKDHVLQSFDPTGANRWSQTVAQCPQMSVFPFGPSAGYLVAPTFSGVLQAYTFDGKRLWQRVMPAQQAPWAPPGGWVSGVGHQGFVSTPDGSLMAVATRGFQTTVYDRDGNLRWYHLARARTDFAGDDPESSHGSMTGGQSIAITADGKAIAVGYADSSIRIFKR